ncbi:MAG: single-stranded DNA-binding protein, partial [Flavobacteriales bacterium]|nr:single-stranded DNA-binding protein [Flavobacteriales bacterium]
GRLVQRSYESKEGEKRYSTEVVLNEFQLLGSRTEAV